MECIEGEKRHSYLDLFRDIPQWKAFIHSAIEDGIGKMVIDNSNSPTMAIIFYGGLVIYVGEPDMKTAEEAVRVFKVQPAVLAYSPFWNNIIEKIYKDKIKTETRYHLPFNSHDRKATKEIFAATKLKTRKINGNDYESLQKILGWEHPDHHYKDSQDFIDNGLGYIFEEDNQIKAGASAYCRAKQYAECQVNTIENYRKSGMATAVSAAFIECCYENDLEIPWDAANEISVNLGQKLGYTEIKPYNTYAIFPE